MNKFGKLLEGWFGWCDHDWSKWTMHDGTKNYRSGSYETTFQLRTCNKCGHSKMKEVN